jgi:quercetin dioxygenase-like cupin family protein
MEKSSFLENLRFGDKVQIDKMVETPFSKEIRICMAGGNVMKEHTAPGAITILVLKGRVTITSMGEHAELENGEMVCFDANVPHSLEAHEESVIRLTLSKNDSVKRVFSLA